MAKAPAYEQYARISLWLGLLAAAGLAAVGFLVFQKFNFQEFELVLKRGGTRFFAILGGTGLSLALAGIGFLLGFSSAGQKRNTLSGTSWVGFFLNAAVMTLVLMVFLVFWFTKDTVTLQ